MMTMLMMMMMMMTMMDDDDDDYCILSFSLGSFSTRYNDDDDDDGRPTCLHYERNVRHIVSLLSVIFDFPQGRPYPFFSSTAQVNASAAGGHLPPLAGQLESLKSALDSYTAPQPQPVVNSQISMLFPDSTFEQSPLRKGILDSHNGTWGATRGLQSPDSSLTCALLTANHLRLC